VHFRILGPLEIVDDNLRPIELDSPRLRAVMCRLLMDAGRVVPHDTIVASVWGDEPPAAANGTLQTYVSRLRRVLEPDRAPRTPARVLVTRPPGYMLALGDGTLDADKLERIVATAAEALDAGRNGDAASLLADGRHLWRGRPFDDVADEAFAAPAVARLEQLRLTALELQVDAWLALGELGTALGELERLVREHPLHERYWAQLITALYRSGRQADALRAFASCRDRLREELGIDPGPDLQALEKAVLDHDSSLAVAPRSTAAQLVSPAIGDVRPASDAGEVANRLERPFVGRSTERAALDDAVRDALAGRGSVITIEGEAGIGKSRLAEAATELAVHNGMTVAWTNCLDEIGAPPLWPWLQLAAEVAGPGAPAGRDLGTGHDEVDADPETARFRQMSNLVHDLISASRGQPLLAVVDDLQWADQASLQLLRLLVGQVGSTQLVLVATVRRPDVGSHRLLETTLADLLRSPHHRRLRLVGLNATEAAELVNSISGYREPELTETLRARTGGNPFFLSETAKLLAAEARDGVAATVGTVAELIPDTVRDVVNRRVQRLPDDSQSMLRLGAVAGASVELAVLAHATGIDADRVCALLEPAVMAGLLIEVNDQIGWRFGHALAQDAVRSTLSHSTRARLHAVLADALEQVHREDIDRHLDELAHHSYEAAPVGRAESALRWSIAAARSAHEHHGHDRAAFHWERSLGLLTSTGASDVERYEVLLLFAEDLRLMGDLDGARARLEEAIRIARSLGDDERAARAAVVFGGVTLWYWRAYGETDWAMVEEVERLTTTAEGPRRAELLGTLGVELYYSNRRADGIAAAEEALALARQLDDVALLGRTLNNFVLAVWEPGPDKRRPAAIDEALAYAGHGLPLQTEVIARVHRAANNLRAGNLSAFEDDLSRCRGIAAELAVPEIRACIIYASGGLAMLRGEWVDAERLAHEAFEIQSRTSLWGAEWATVVQLVPIYTALGRTDEVVDEALRIALLPGMDATRATAALAVAEAGDRAEARRLAERWWSPNRQPDWTTDHTTAEWGTLAARIGYPDPRFLYDQMLQFADRLVVAGTAVACRGSAQRVLGQLSSAIGDRDAARRHFVAARERNRSVGARWHAEQAQSELDRLE
jgi:DNA-binding SARP family transcriptional activator